MWSTKQLSDVKKKIKTIYLSSIAWRTKSFSPPLVGNYSFKQLSWHQIDIPSQHSEILLLHVDWAYVYYSVRSQSSNVGSSMHNVLCSKSFSLANRFNHEDWGFFLHSLHDFSTDCVQIYKLLDRILIYKSTLNYHCGIVETLFCQLHWCIS